MAVSVGPRSDKMAGDVASVGDSCLLQGKVSMGN
jgi:hypothetical protein